MHRMTNRNRTGIGVAIVKENCSETQLRRVYKQSPVQRIVINPLNAELNPICYLLALLELTIFSTLAG